MKTGLFALFAIAVLTACNQASGSRMPKAVSHPAEQPIGKSDKDPRGTMVSAIKKLGVEIRSGDKSRILSIFHFPQPDSLFDIYPDDPSFSREKAATAYLTIEIASHHYKDIHRSLQLDQFARLFAILNIDSLQQEKQIEATRAIKGKPCAHFYEIRTVGNRVWFVYGTRSNPDYTPSAKEAEEIIGDECEYATIWEFMLADGKLVFVSQKAAG